MVSSSCEMRLTGAGASSEPRAKNMRRLGVSSRTLVVLLVLLVNPSGISFSPIQPPLAIAPIMV